MNANKFRDGIFNLKTRRLGKVAELMIQRLISCGKGRSLFHDLYDEDKNHLIEVKFSTVRKKNDRTLSEETVLKGIEDELAENRQVSFKSWKNFTFDCNIQQIKKDQFDSLYYGLFFHDVVLIFKIGSHDITKENLNYSDKQHKGNKGEGQFHINQDTLPKHLKDYLYKQITYEQLLELLR
ncbi:hypothetical protein WDW86_22305 [Bdellovibrionota bacterium FG-2]